MNPSTNLLSSLRRVFSRADRGTPTAPAERWFWAFISYSHADETWAKWLHEALERYRVPKALVGRTTPKGAVPRRLHPIFRDRDELPGSPSLKHEIEMALERSRSLVVICSPHAAASRYVDGEIRSFKQRGRDSDIYCLLVDGEPNATDKPECGLPESLPAAVRFRVGRDGELTDERAEPLAADVRKGRDGREHAKLKIIAGVLGIGFDELRRREARRQFQQRVQVGAAALAVLIVIAGVWWNRQVALEGQRQIALAQRLIDQSTELLDSEDADAIQRGSLLILQAMTRLERQEPDFDLNGEAAQARLAADQNLRRALSLFYTPGPALSAAPPPQTYEDNGWASWTAEAVGFSPDGDILTAASGWGSDPSAAIVRWRVNTGLERQRLRLGQEFDWPGVTTRMNPRYFALSADGEYFAGIAERSWLGQPSAALLHHIPENREIKRLRYTGRLTGVSLGPRGEYLAIASQTIKAEPAPLQLWRVANEASVSGIPNDASTASPKALAFSADGRYLGIAAHDISLWELPRNPGESAARAGPKLDLYRGEAIAFSPDGRYLAAAGAEATMVAGGKPTDFGRRVVRVWDLAESRTVADVPAAETIRGLALSVGAKYLAVIDDEHSLMLHALSNGQATRVHFNPAGRSRFINPGGKGPGQYGRLTAAAFSPRDDVLAMAGEIDAAIWRVSSFDQQFVLGFEGDVKALAFDRDDRRLITIRRTTDARTAAVQVWDVETGHELPQRRRDYAADAFKLTRTGEVVLATDDARGSGRGGSVIIDVGGKIERFRYDGDVQRILVSQDGEHIAVASSLGASSSAPVSSGRQLVTVWRLPSPVQVLRFKYTTKERDNSIPQAFFILGNRWYLGVDDGETIDGGGRRSTFVLWDVKGGEIRGERTEEISRLWREDLTSSADGRWSALESNDVVRVFTTAHEREVARIAIALPDRDPDRLTSRVVALGSKGRYVAAITSNRTVRVWPVDVSRLRSLACARLTRDLSPEEWAAYLPTEEPEPTCRRQ
jgi:WD40 repeat protein